MANRTFIGVGNVAKRAKKIFIGVNGVPKKVKKVYIGVNGVPKKVYSADFTFYSNGTNGNHFTIHNESGGVTTEIINGRTYYTLTGNWWIDVVKNCTFTLDSIGDYAAFDVWLIGGGQGGGAGANGGSGGKGGNGGKAFRANNKGITDGATYTVTIGTGGSAGNLAGIYDAHQIAGNAGNPSKFVGGSINLSSASGSVVGNGGTGHKGLGAAGKGGDGDYPFGASKYGQKYGAGGGGGCSAYGGSGSGVRGLGGTEGGGDGQGLANSDNSTVYSWKNGTKNTGSGGGGGGGIANGNAGAGGSGRVIFRNKR